MAGTTSCRTCGQVNADGTEYCVRCGTRMPDPSSTQLVGPGGAGGAPEYPWEPPAEWDPGELPAAGGQPPAPTWVANTPADQVGWNTGHDTGSQPPGYPPTYPPAQPPTYPPTAGAPAAPKPAGSRKALLIGATAVVVIAAIVAVVLVAGGGKKKNSNGGGTQTAALNGVQNESGTDALASAREALRAAGSAQITGTVLDAGQPIRLDLTLAAGDNSAGTLTINNADVQLIKVGQTVFIKGDMDFLKKYAGNNTAVLNQLNGKWLKTTTTTDFDLFTLDGFAGLLKGGTGSSAVVPKVTQSTLNGQKIVVVSQKDGSTLDHRQHRPRRPPQTRRQGQRRRHPHLHQLQQERPHHRPARQRSLRRQQRRRRHPDRHLHLHRQQRHQRRNADPASRQQLHGERRRHRAARGDRAVTRWRSPAARSTSTRPPGTAATR